MRVGIAGVGSMGAAFARRLEQAGHELVLWNRSPAACEEFAAGGASVVASPAELFAETDVSLTALADGRAVEVVGEQLLAGSPGGSKVWVETSTIDVASSARVAARAAAAGVEYLRAPVSGNPAVVAAGNLTIIASGNPATLQRVEPLLRAIGPHLFEVGAGEEARVMKLVLALMIAASNQMLAESLVLAEANGLERAATLEIIAASAVGSPFVSYKAPPLLADDYTSTFSAALLAKDIDLVIECAEASGAPTPALAPVRETIAECVEAGMGELDLSVVVPLLRRRAGLEDALPGE